MIKPFVWGAVLGTVIVAIVAFSAEWIVTGSSKDDQVKAAWIDGQAIVCSAIAQARRTASGETSDISGYNARETRETLAKQAAVALAGQDAPDWRVVNACADNLISAGT